VGKGGTGNEGKEGHRKRKDIPTFANRSCIATLCIRRILMQFSNTIVAVAMPFSLSVPVHGGIAVYTM